MSTPDYLQSILGTSKSNPSFSVHRHSVSGDYHVYYGVELFEVVPCDHENPQFKLMIAHMHNIGVSLRKLHEVFGIDPRTMLKWSRALKSGSAEKLTQALAGRDIGRKLTRPIQEYVRIRFPRVYEDDKRGYSGKLRKEIEQVFNVKLSGETLRLLFNKLRAQEVGAACVENGAGNSEADPSDEEGDSRDQGEDDPLPPESAAPPDGDEAGEVKNQRSEQGEALKSVGEPLEALD